MPTVPVVDVAIFLKVEGCLAVCCDFVISKSLGLDLRKIWTKFHYTSFPKGCKLVGRYNRTSRPTETVWFPFILLSTYKQSAYIRTLCKRPMTMNGAIYMVQYLCAKTGDTAIRLSTVPLPLSLSREDRRYGNTSVNIHGMSSNWKSRNQRQKGIKISMRFKFTQFLPM